MRRKPPKASLFLSFHSPPLNLFFGLVYCFGNALPGVLVVSPGAVKKRCQVLTWHGYKTSMTSGTRHLFFILFIPVFLSLDKLKRRVRFCRSNGCVTGDSFPVPRFFVTLKKRNCFITEVTFYLVSIFIGSSVV